MANGGNFLRGAVVGSCIAVFALGIGAKALGQPINLQEDTAEVARSDNRSERAEVLGGDWGALHVAARDGQRITAYLSLSEVTRVAFEDDTVVGVRAAQNGRPESPLIEFEQDATTGDLYIVVAQGSANQVISAFVTTLAGQTYHFLFTIKEQPATQIFVEAADRDWISNPMNGEGRAQARETNIVEFAHLAMNVTELERPSRPLETFELRPDVRLVHVGDASNRGFHARIFEIQNASNQIVPVMHDAFLAQGVVAVVSLLDQVPPGSTVRLAVLETAGDDDGGR